MSFDPILQIVQVHPTTKSGSTVATVKLWVDEAVLNSSTSLIIEKLTGLIQHNFSELVVPHFSSHVQPLFEMSPSENSSISSIFYLNLNSATLPRLTASSMERCAVTSSAKRYVAISIDLKLLSDFSVSSWRPQYLHECSSVPKEPILRVHHTSEAKS